MKIAVTSGYARSRHAIALVTLLHRAGHQVGLCLCVKAFTFRRLRAYLRFYGSRLFSIAYRRMFAGASAAQADAEVKYVQSFMQQHDIQHPSLRQACDEAGTKLLHVDDLNAPSALDALGAFKPALVIYAGGGLLRDSFIKLPTIGVLNAHGGPLPAIRGMNAAEWSLLRGLQPGSAVHFVDSGVDTGPVLFFKPQEILPTDHVADVRGKGVVTAVESLLEAVQQIDAKGHSATPQKTGEGLQYFTMHSLLLDIVEDRLAQRPRSAATGGSAR